MTVGRPSDNPGLFGLGLYRRNGLNYATGKAERYATLKGVEMAGRRAACDIRPFFRWGLSPIGSQSGRTRFQLSVLGERRPAPRADLQQMQDTTNTQPPGTGDNCEVVKGGEPSINLGSPPKTAGRHGENTAVVNWSYPIKVCQLRRKEETTGTCTQLKNNEFALHRLTTRRKTRRRTAVSTGEPPSPQGFDRVHHPTNTGVNTDV